MGKGIDVVSLASYGWGRRDAGHGLFVCVEMCGAGGGSSGKGRSEGGKVECLLAREVRLPVGGEEV